MNCKCIGQWLSKTIVLLKDYRSLLTIVLQKSHDEIVTTVTDTLTPLNEIQ